MYTALYLPASYDYDPTRSGFISEDKAIDFVVKNHLCHCCEDEGWGSACASEWIIIKTDEMGMCETVGDIFDAAGYTRVENCLDVKDRE